MRRIESNQRNVEFIYCSSPVTIDKSSEWGEGNLQNFPNGVFLKVKPENNTIVTHGIEPNKLGDCPTGWIEDSYGFQK